MVPVFVDMFTLHPFNITCVYCPHLSFIIILPLQANRGYAAEAFFGGKGGAWYEKGVTLCGLRISEKKEILCKLTVL
jgi:hypothetical protein